MARLTLVLCTLFFLTGCAGQGCYTVARETFEREAQQRDPNVTVGGVNFSALLWCLPFR